MIVANPVNFDIDTARGFLPATKDTILSTHDIKALYISSLASHEIPKFLVGRRVSLAVDCLQEMSRDFLLDLQAPALNRIMRHLSFIAHAYVHEDPQNRRDSIPANLALSWYRVAKLLGRPPVLSYKSYALDNWRLIKKDEPVHLGNIALLNNFYGGLDEEWFVLVHVDIEAKAAPIIRMIPEAQQAVLDNDLEKLQQCLEVIASAQVEMITTLKRMPENCDPYIYFNRVRPFIHGWDRRPLIYEGVKEYAGQPQKFRGETGAQSSIVPTLDALFDVYHAPNEMTQYLDDMLNYMPPNHRDFIDAVGGGPSIRGALMRYKKDKPELAGLYNANILALYHFRSLHLEYANRYIFSQLPKTLDNPNNRGTGGTPLEYLKKHCDETLAARL